MRAVVILNPAAGPRGWRAIESRRGLARRLLASHGVDAEIAVVERPTDGFERAAAAREAGVDRVIAWGGDGTVNGIARALVGGSTALAIVPGGSGNGLARSLGIPRQPARALAVAAAGRLRRIDAGQLDETWFFNVAGIGLDAAIARRLTSPRARRGMSGYLVATTAELVRRCSRRYELEIDGAATTVVATFLALANSPQYGGGARIAPRARLDDGHLDLVVVEDLPLWQVLARLPALFRGSLEPGRGVRMHTFATLAIRAVDGAPVMAHVDGEPVVGSSTVRVQSRPAALTVVTP